LSADNVQFSTGQKQMSPNHRLHSTGKHTVAGTALLQKLFKIVELVGSGNNVSIQDLASETGWPRATLYRIVGAAISEGFLRNDPLTNHYALGFRFLELAQNVWSSGDLITLAALELRRLRDVTGETAHLGVLQGIHVVAMGKYDSPHPYREAAPLGLHKTLHSTSQGKAILAFLPQAECERLIEKITLTSATDYTITDADILKAQLSIVRQRGYAVDDEEAAIGTRCVGAPILNSFGHPVAAISIAGPVYRVTSARVERLGPEIAEVAQTISTLIRDTHDKPNGATGSASVRPTNDKPALYGVSPRWNPKAGVLHWGDRLAPRIHTSAGALTSYKFATEKPIDVVCYSADNLVAYSNGLLLSVGPGGQIQERVVEGLERLSALAVHPDGTPFGARIDETETGSAIGPLGADGRLQEKWHVVGEVSDLAWSADGILYAAVGERGLIYAISPRSAAPRILTRISKASGEPRALATDIEGRVWVALYDGWSIVRLTAEGEIQRVVAVPVPRPTGLAFGTEPSGILYITSARIDLSRDVLENSPLSGRPLMAEVGVAGFVPPPMRYIPGAQV
jgi:IclR family acetate operon transcriptional repressor